MKNMIWVFLICNVGAIILLFLPDGMLLTDAPDGSGASWSNFRFLCIVHTVPNIIAWLVAWINYRKIRVPFIMFLIFEILTLSYVYWMFIGVKSG
ncbi:hypothetical protein CN514_22745 [Bacillus sp. AFS001701]|uniref:hypothetical protein n=1 Tax=Bacillus sp. AFS001701 TaxID=2033480 RepID=UPI000BF60AC8|nr:hypothetical protein [Bacillus sp. AFS001701]PET42342.1 hypothetical protein CN514_22745 [Bacillus sp. AFS001701]